MVAGPGAPVGTGVEPADLGLLAAAEDGADRVGKDQGRMIAYRAGDGILGNPRHEPGERGQDRLHADLGRPEDQRRAAWKGSGSRPANGFRPAGHVSRGFS